MESVETLEGKEIGKYKLHKMVGDGGQAVVYKAWHNDLHAWVAIKFLKNDLAKRDAVRQRFKQEARLQFRLQHPHIVRVIEIIDEGTWLGMAMDWVEGQDLEQYLAKHPGPVPYAEIERLLIPILHAVDYAHKQQIVHRDLKPSNILLHGPRGEEIPKVMDFGIAKSLASEESQTKTGSVLGTPSYLAPEQAQSTKHVDHRADIYALGITLYQMISGRLPFVGDDILQLIMAHFTEPPPPFEHFGLMVPSKLRAVVHKALEKSPDARFSSCKEFAVQLQAVLKETIDSGATSALPAAQSTHSMDSLPQAPISTPAGLLPSGEVLPEHNTIFRSDTLLPDEETTATASSKRHLIAIAGGLLVVLVLVAIAFRSPQSPQPPPTTPSPLTQTKPPNTATPPIDLANRPHPPTLPPSIARPAQPANAAAQQTHTSPRPTATTNVPNPTKPTTDPTPPTAKRDEPPTLQKTRPRPRQRAQAVGGLSRCIACLQRFARQSFGPDGDGLSPCTLGGMSRAARNCRAECRRNALVFCRSYPRVRSPMPLGGTAAISSMSSCLSNLRHRLDQIAKNGGYKPPTARNIADCRKASTR